MVTVIGLLGDCIIVLSIFWLSKLLNIHVLWLLPLTIALALIWAFIYNKLREDEY